jgi:hypothetical protein
MSDRPLRCLDGGRGDCKGPVELRAPLSPTGVPHARCDKHWEWRLEKQEQIDRDFPDSDIPPAWFNPLDAGERWSEDD